MGFVSSLVTVEEAELVELLPAKSSLSTLKAIYCPSFTKLENSASVKVNVLVVLMSAEATVIVADVVFT